MPLLLYRGAANANTPDLRVTALRRKARGDEQVSVVTPAHLAEALAAADHVVNVVLVRHFLVNLGHFLAGAPLEDRVM